MPLDFNRLIDEAGRLFLEQPDEGNAFLYLRATVCGGLANEIGWEVGEFVLQQVNERLGHDDAVMKRLSLEVQALDQWVKRGQSQSYKVKKGVKP